MPPHADSTSHLRAPIGMIGQSIAERILASLRRWRAPEDIPRLLDRWIEGRRSWDAAGWVQRAYPCYQFTFSEDVRGQTIRAYLDFHAELGHLGLYLYWPTQFDPARSKALYPLLNRINWECGTGCMEIDPEDGVLRYRATLGTRDAKLSIGYLDRMLKVGLEAFEKNAKRFLTGPTGAVAEK